MHGAGSTQQLRPTDGGFGEDDGAADSNHKNVLQRFGSVGGPDPNSPSNTHDKNSTSILDGKSVVPLENDHLVGMENRFPARRNIDAEDGKFCQSHTNGDNHLLRATPKVIESKTVLANKFRRSSEHLANDRRSTQHQEMDGGKSPITCGYIQFSSEKMAYNTNVDSSQHKIRSSGSVGDSCIGRAVTTRLAAINGEALRQVSPPFSCVDNSLFEGQAQNSVFNEHAAGHNPFVTHRVTRRVKRTKVSVNFNSPLHVRKVQAINLPLTKLRMAATCKQRFEEVWSLSFQEQRLQNLGTNAPKFKARREDSEKFVDSGIARKVLKGEGEERHFLEAFTVDEEKSGQTRRRMIFWPKKLNEQLLNSYKASIPLDHISKYLHSVKEDFGVCRDLTAGFYQIPIPKKAQRFFSFMDEESNIFELLRLPMGLATAPEICHILTSVVAGNAIYVKPEFALKRVEVWIDNIRITGDKDYTEYASYALDEAAKNLGFQFNECEQPLQKYSFLGVEFNHATKSVRPAEKTINKIKTSSPNLTIEDLESLVSRLLYTAGINRYDLTKVFWLLKMTRRRLSEVNKGTVDVTAPSNLPESAKHELTWWCNFCFRREWTIVRSYAETKSVLYTDSTLQGWGAVLVDHNNQVRIAGDRWRVPFVNVNEAECTAVLEGLTVFSKFFPGHSLITVVVDNTSVMHCVNKGSTKSEDMNTKLSSIVKMCAERVWKLKVSYIRSKENPADPPSRAIWGTELAKGWVEA